MEYRLSVKNITNGKNYKEMTAFATYYDMDLAKHCGCDCAQIWLCILIDEGVFSFKESEYEMICIHWSGSNYGN